MMAKSPKPNILFFCKHNSCRSQMAEAYLKYMAPDAFEVCSAGLSPEPIHPLVDTAKSVDHYLGKQPFDHIIIVCQEGEAECPKLYPFALHVERWSLSDPAEVTGETQEEVLQAFRHTRDAIKRRLKDWLIQNK
jgi:arsenate reductase